MAIETPELNSVHSVKILLCYLLDRISGFCPRISDEKLRLISDESEVINYFYFQDAIDELIKNGSVDAEPLESGERMLTLTEKGRMGAEYFNMTLPLVFRKKLIKTALAYFSRIEGERDSKVSVHDTESGCTVDFSVNDGVIDLMQLSFYAPDREQAELIAERIRDNPRGAYGNILMLLLGNKEEEINVDKYL